MTVGAESKGHDSGSSGRTAGRSLRVVIAGGGTGGHLFPGIALAQAFMGKDPGNEILFVGAGNPFEKRTLANAGFRHKSISVEGIKGRGFIYQLKAVLMIPKGFFESLKIIREFKPDLVLGVGSYSSGPFIAASRLTGVKIALHEQNIIPGITNRILSLLADRIYVSFEKTKKELSPRKALLTGNPIRREIVEAAGGRSTSPNQDSKMRFRVLVLGGSQGAHKINMTVAEAIPLLKNKDDYRFVHQTGIKDEKYVAEAYRNSGVSFVVKPFFEDMAGQYLSADLVICRAGATTVAEIAVMGAGAIFIPYPHAADDHQALNAGALSGAGASEMILEKDLTPGLLSERIEYFAKNPDALDRMKSSVKSFGRPDAADAIVEDCYRLVCKSSVFNGRLMAASCLCWPAIISPDMNSLMGNIT